MRLPMPAVLERVSPTAILSRRELLRVGALAVSGIALPELLAAREASRGSGSAARAEAAIVIYLNGGPSHLDMWDMKPEAPIEIRGEFASIDTSLPGVRVCEHLPRLSRHVHRAALVRSMRHNVNNSHALAVYTAMTGHDRGDAGILVGAGRDDHPSPGSVLTLLRPPERNIVPYVALPYRTREGAGGPPQPGFDAGILGQGFDPMWILEDPNQPGFSVPSLALAGGLTAERFADRTRLRDRLDARRRFDPQAGQPDPLDRFRERAVSLLAAGDTRRAFDLRQEPDAVRDRYGRNEYGQSTLLARRLVEAGTRLVTVCWAPHANATWDTHGGNFKSLKERLLPQFDAAASSLLEDLVARNLLDSTLVVVTGDFGRTPKINNNNGGRDHWNNCYTILLAGGGIAAGTVVGASDRTGSLPAERPTGPSDIVATMYRLLGCDPQAEIHDQLARPFPIARGGHVVPELLA